MVLVGVSWLWKYWLRATEPKPHPVTAAEDIVRQLAEYPAPRSEHGGYDMCDFCGLQLTPMDRTGERVDEHDSWCVWAKARRWVVWEDMSPRDPV